MGCMLLGNALPSILPDFAAASDLFHCYFVCYGNAHGLAMVVGRNSSMHGPNLVLLRYFDSGWSVRRIFNEVMSFSSLCNVFRLIKQFKETFSWLPPASTTAQRARALDRIALQLVDQMLIADPTLHLKQIKNMLYEKHQVTVSTSSICRSIHLSVDKGDLGLTLKKLSRGADVCMHFHSCTHACARARFMIYSLAGARCSKRPMSACLSSAASV